MKLVAVELSGDNSNRDIHKQRQEITTMCLLCRFFLIEADMVGSSNKSGTITTVRQDGMRQRFAFNIGYFFNKIKNSDVFGLKIKQ